MKTQYYKIQNSFTGAYDMTCDGIILAVRGENEWLLTDRYCGDNTVGYKYRQYVGASQKSWPKAADKAIDKTEFFAELFADADCSLNAIFSTLNAKDFREFLKI
jgi:hypothetical protein